MSTEQYSSTEERSSGEKLRWRIAVRAMTHYDWALEDAHRRVLRRMRWHVVVPAAALAASGLALWVLGWSGMPAYAQSGLDALCVLASGLAVCQLYDRRASDSAVCALGSFAMDSEARAQVADAALARVRDARPANSPTRP